jgi:hypothetical protein
MKIREVPGKKTMEVKTEEVKGRLKGRYSG